jgi:predicted O-methyltransferase YrrM
MPLQRVSQTSIGAGRIRGPVSQYLNRNETELLVALVRSVMPRVMIEFGCNLGFTAKRVLDNVPSLECYIGIDVPAGHETTLTCQRNEVPTAAGSYAASDERFWLLMVEERLTADQLEPCDAVFIDGDHSEQGVSRDSDLARALVRPGGIIVWHDAGNPAVEVTATLERLADQGWPIKHIENSWLAFMRT